MAPPNDLHLRRGGFHAPTAPLQHGAQQIPTAVGHEFQQRLIDHRQRHIGASGRAAIGQLGFNRHLGFAAHGVAVFVGAHLYIDVVRLAGDADFRHAQAVGGFGQIHQRRGRNVFTALEPKRRPPLARRFVAPGEEAVPGHVAQAPAQGQHADVHVRPPAFAHRQAQRGVLALQGDYLLLQDALALHAHQRSGVAKRHTHLEHGCFTRLVAFLFGQQVNAVVVFTAKPQLALARDPHRGPGLGFVAVFVACGGHQFDFTGLIEAGLAQQQATAIALAGTHRAQVFGLGGVVVAVKAAHHALARCRGGTGNGLHRQGHARQRFAVQAQRQHLKARTRAAGGPALGLDAHHHGGRPQGVRAAQGLHFAVGVGKAGFQQQLLGRALRGQVLQRHAACALGVEREGQFVSHHTAVLAGTGLLVIAVAAACLRALGAGRIEMKFVPIGVEHWFAAHQSRHAHRQARRRTARDVLHLHLGRQLAHAHQGLAVHRGNAPLQHGQAKFLHAKAARLQHLLTAVQRQLVHAQFGRRWHLPLAGAAAPAGRRFAPGQRLAELLATAHMGDDQALGPALGQAQALAGLAAHKVLHGQCFPRAQQAAIEHGVRHPIGLGHLVGGQVEAPGLDATLPVAPGEGHVLHAFVLGTRADEIRAAPLPFALTGWGLGREAFQLRQALAIGARLCQHPAIAVRHLHLRVGHTLAFVQRGHPGAGVFAPQLEMHGQIGHQRRRAYIHGACAAVARIQQHLAQQRRSDFHHMKAHWQRNAHHLERARIVAAGAWQLQLFHPTLARQQRHHARLHRAGIGVVRQCGRQGARDIAAHLLALQGERFIACQLALPGNDLGVAAWLQRAHGQALQRQIGLDLAQRHWQQRGWLGGRRAFSKALDDAKGRSSKLGQRRHLARGHRHGKAAGIGQGAACVVLKAIGQHQLVAAARRQRCRELQPVHHGIFLGCIGQARLQADLLRLQPHRLGQLAWHRRIEMQAQRHDGQAGRLGVGTLATEGGGKRRTHAVGEALGLAVGYTAGGGHAGAKHQRHLAARA